MMALRAGNEELAKEALARKREHDELADTFKDQWTKQKTAVEQLKKALAHAQRQDRGGEAQEERPHRPEEARRGAAARSRRR